VILLFVSSWGLPSFGAPYGAPKEGRFSVR